MKETVSMNTSSSAPFQEERPGLDLHWGEVVNVKIQIRMLVLFFFLGGGLKFGQILSVFRGVSNLLALFF